jgi:hypothetical protein
MVSTKTISFHKKHSMHYFEISAMKQGQFEISSLSLAPQMFGNENRSFIVSPTIQT